MPRSSMPRTRLSRARRAGELLNPASGKCLDATGPSSANGTRLQIWTCADSANQQWNIPS